MWIWTVCAGPAVYALARIVSTIGAPSSKSTAITAPASSNNAPNSHPNRTMAHLSLIVVASDKWRVASVLVPDKFPDVSKTFHGHPHSPLATRHSLSYPNTHPAP